MCDYVLEMNHITKEYQDGEQTRQILNDVSLKIKKGEFIAIVGPSGSGKSTLLTISGMMLSPDAGEVCINGVSMSDQKKKDWTKLRKKHIGFIFQSHELLPYLKGKEQLTAFQSKENKEKIDVLKIMEELGVGNCSNQYPVKMSGGEKQRIAIARAFANNPDIILADEPTASLDGERGRQVVAMIKKEVKKWNKAAVIVTHDERVLEYVDKIYHLEDGILVEK